MINRGLDVAYYWSPGEAAAILEYLDRLRDLVWETYREDIIELRQSELEFDEQGLGDDEPDLECQRTFHFDDDIDF